MNWHSCAIDGRQYLTAKSIKKHLVFSIFNAPQRNGLLIAHNTRPDVSFLSDTTNYSHLIPFKWLQLKSSVFLKAKPLISDINQSQIKAKAISPVSSYGGQNDTTFDLLTRRRKWDAVGENVACVRAEV